MRALLLAPLAASLLAIAQADSRPAPLATLGASRFRHDGPVVAVDVSPDGATFVSATASELRVWDTKGAALRARFPSKQRIGSLRFSLDGARLAVGGPGELRFLKASTFETDSTLSRNGRFVNWSPKSLDIVDAAVRKIEPKGGAIAAAALSSDGALVAIASGSTRRSDPGATLTLYDAETAKETRELKLDGTTLTAVEFSPAGDRLAVGAAEGTIRFVDLPSMEVRVPLPAHRGPVLRMRFSPDGKRLASGGSEGEIRIADSANGDEQRRIAAHRDAVLDLAWTPRGDLLLSAGADGTLSVRDPATGAPAAASDGHEGAVSGVAFSPDGALAATASYDGVVRLWDAKTGTLRRELRGHDGWVYGIVWSRDGASVVSAGKDATVRVWDAATGAERTAWRARDAAVLAISSSAGADIVAVAGADGSARLLDLRDGREMHRCTAAGIASACALSPDGKRLAVGSSRLEIFDLKSGTRLLDLAGSKSPIASIAWSPSGDSIASAHADTTVRLHDAATGKELHVLRGSPSRATAVAFSPDGATLASAAYGESEIRLWDARSGAARGVRAGHRAPVLALAFSRAGLLLSGSQDATALVWGAP